MQRVPPPRRPRPTAAPTPPPPGLGPDSLAGLSADQVSARAAQAQQRSDSARRTSQARALADRVAAVPPPPKAKPAPTPAPEPQAVTRIPIKPTPPADDFTPAELEYIGRLVREDKARRDAAPRPPYARY